MIEHIQNKTIIITAIFVLFTSQIKAQLVINEICASNATLIEDAEYQDYSDWIEIYNSGPEGVDLHGYYITDNLKSANKYQIPTSTYIPAGEYLLIWADGNNNGLHTNFKLSAEGEEVGIYNANLEIIDSVIFDYQKANISYGRNENNGWSYFNSPTPNSANNSTAYAGFVNNTPEFSARGGMYNSAITVELSTDLGGEIRYTTNGSEPTESAALYSQALSLNKTTILRARVFKPNLIPGLVVTQSYFINENSTNAKLPVISLATNASNFWDPSNGIFVQDFKPLWEVPVNIELFENNGSDRAAFNELAGTKVNGLWSWQLPQKMLGVYFRKQYNESKLEYPIFGQRKRASYKSFALRASGSDWSYTLMRDIVGQHSTLYNMDIDIMSYKPACLFLNGEFLAITNMREKVDDDYIENSYNLESGTFDLIENEEYVEAGTIDAYNNFHALLSKDLSSESNYNAVAELMDIENFTDYVITEMATANTSISHNVMAWKPHNEGKWRWILMDLDRGFFRPGEHLLNFYLGQNVWPLADLFDNQSYQQYFGRRLADQLFTSFNPDRFAQIIDEHKALIEDEIPRHVERWMGTTSDYGNALPSVEYWYDEVQDLKDFAQARPSALLNDLQNYGFSGTVNLSLSTLPIKGGQIFLNNLKVPQGTTSGPYLKNIDINIEAKATPGYSFIGWSSLSTQTLLAKQSEWNYLDNGTVPNEQWTTTTFDDGAWKTGAAELGYGDGDENTVVDYGVDADNKNITTYFRKSINLSTEQLLAKEFLGQIKFDDGIIVYVNGVEVARFNLPNESITHQTLASDWVSGSSEETFTSFSIQASLFNEGENIIAAEVHQGSASSSDLSFDMEIVASYLGSEIVSNENLLQLNLNANKSLTAVFELASNCILPEVVNSDLHLQKDCSPYFAHGNVHIMQGATLHIEPGVEILMPEQANLFINGAIIAQGSENEPITFKNNTQYSDSWGVLSFKNTSDTSELNHVIIEGASFGPDHVNEIAAISAFNTNLVLSNLTLINNFGNPIFAKYSSIKLSNSTLHSDITGDLINVKYGKAEVKNCRFIGNDMPDTDAIDYDEIENGIIESCEITNFLGSNSDGIDIGEKATNITIDSLWVFSTTDKGVSVGQRSSVKISNSIFVNCDMGVGVKDSSHAYIEHSVFYGNNQAVSCFEKNLGKAGGNANIVNSILSNSAQNSVYSDNKSKLNINFSLSDTDTLVENNNNIHHNPHFENVSTHNYTLQSQSAAINAGLKNNESVNLGANHPVFNWQPNVLICQLFTNPLNIDYPEFIALYNPANTSIDLSNYKVTKGFTATIPEGTILAAKDTLYLTSNSESFRWWNQQKQIIQWSEGKLSNNGENIQLENSYGIIIDFLRFDINKGWPQEFFNGNNVMTLKSEQLDNHFAENWSTDSVSKVFDESNDELFGILKVYPNPAKNEINIQVHGVGNTKVELLNLSGQLFNSFYLNAYGHGKIDISNIPNGLYFVKTQHHTKKLIILH